MRSAVLTASQIIRTGEIAITIANAVVMSAPAHKVGRV